MIDLKHINMVSELERLGIQFRQAGPNAHAAICPLHADTDPSFHVYHDSDKDKFKCFGCGKHGDIIDFLMAYYGCDWNEAAAKVGVELEKHDEQRIKFLKRQAQLEEAYKTWKIEMVSGLRHLCEMAHEAIIDGVIPETMHEAAPVIKSIVKWNQWMQIILSGKESEVLEIYKRERKRFKPVTDFARQDFERRAYGS